MKKLRVALSIPLLAVGLPLLVIAYLVLSLAGLIAEMDFVEMLEEQ